MCAAFACLLLLTTGSALARPTGIERLQTIHLRPFALAGERYSFSGTFVVTGHAHLQQYGAGAAEVSGGVGWSVFVKAKTPKTLPSAELTLFNSPAEARAGVWYDSASFARYCTKSGYTCRPVVRGHLPGEFVREFGTAPPVANGNYTFQVVYLRRGRTLVRAQVANQLDPAAARREAEAIALHIVQAAQRVDPASLKA